MAAFQDSVRKILTARNLISSNLRDEVDDDGEEEEEEEVSTTVAERKSLRRRSFHKAVRKVVHSQASFRTVDPKYSKQVLYPSRSRVTLKQVPVTGGQPITAHLAIELRNKIFGAADLLTFSLTEWLQHAFCFHEAGTTQAYGLKVANASTKGLAMCVQALVLKYILFSSHKHGAVVADIPKLLRTTKKAQVDSLVGALSDVLWRLGGKERAVLCLTSEPAFSNDPDFMEDGCTERVVMYEFGKYEELKFTIRKYLYELVTEGQHGMLLFLYSVVLTRSLPKILEDMDGEEGPLVQTNGALHPCMATLVLTGRATPYLHNGILYEGDEDSYSKPKTGVLVRTEIGMLVWSRQDGDDQVSVGSRLKTPTLPIWVTRCNDSYGVLFNPNRDLMRDYHAENRFDIYYYSSSSTQTAATILTVDTRTSTSREEYQLPYLDHVIHTKWMDAEVCWNGTAPYL